MVDTLRGIGLPWEERILPPSEDKPIGKIGASRAGFTTVGVASVLVMNFQFHRKRAEFVNDSINVIYLTKQVPAVVGSGIRLNANGGSYVIEPDATGRIWLGQIYAIATAAASNLTWCEDW